MHTQNSISLEEFIRLEKERLVRFEAYWKEMNKVDPDLFPMEIQSDNTGQWDEMLTIFED